MNLFDRIVLTIYTLFLAVVSVLVILFSTKIFPLEEYWTRLELLYGRWEVGVVGLIFLLMSMRFLLSGIKSQHFPEATIKDGELGNICISLNAIENLILKITRDFEKVKDVKVNLRKKEDGISIKLKLVVTNDVVIPDLTAELQKTVKDYVESTTGINVEQININVDNVFNPYKQNKQRTLK